MEAALQKIKQSTLIPLSNLLNGKGNILIGAGTVVFISTMFSTLVSWSLSSHGVHQSFLEHQGSFLASQRNITEVLASAVKNLQNSQQEVRDKISSFETALKRKASKSFMNTELQKMKKNVSAMNTTFLTLKSTVESTTTEFQEFKTTQSGANQNTAEEITKMKEDDQTRQNKIDEQDNIVKDLKEKIVKANKERLEQKEIVDNLKTNISTTSALVDEVQLSLSNRKEKDKTMEEKMNGIKEEFERVDNTTRDLSMAAIIGFNSSDETVLKEHIDNIQGSLVTALTKQAKDNMKILGNNIDKKLEKLRDESKRMADNIKEDLKKFKKTYQDERHKTLGYLEIGNDGLYMVSSSSRSWTDAQRDCTSKLGYLVEFASKEEQDEVVSFLETSNSHLNIFWLGGRDHSTEGNFVWEHSQTPMNDGFSSWREGEPNNYGQGEDCVEYTDGLWNDVDCDESRHYICKYEKKNLDIE